MQYVSKSSPSHFTRYDMIQETIRVSVLILRLNSNIEVWAWSLKLKKWNFSENNAEKWVRYVSKFSASHFTRYDMI